MEQYHQQLQQAQRHYQQNGDSAILAPPSYASRNTHGRQTESRSAPQQVPYGPSGRPSVTSSKPSTSHISDSHRSLVGAISLPDSGYHYSPRSSSFEPRVRGTLVVPSPDPNQIINKATPQVPSSGVKSSLSADSGTQFFIPPGQPQKTSLYNTTANSSPSIPVPANQPVRTPLQTLTNSTSATSDRSSIRTAPPITPISSDSRIVSFSDSARSALEPTYKTTAAAGPGRRAAETERTMTSADDIVADSEGEEEVVQGTLDPRDAERPAVLGSVAGASRKCSQAE